MKEIIVLINVNKIQATRYYLTCSENLLPFAVDPTKWSIKTLIRKFRKEIATVDLHGQHNVVGDVTCGLGSDVSQ